MVSSRRGFFFALACGGVSLGILNPALANALQRIRFTWNCHEIGELMNSRPGRAAYVDTNKVADGWKLVNSRNNKSFVLNHTAGLIWSLCDGRHNVEDMVSHLVRHYDVDAARCRGDVLMVLLAWRREGLLAASW